MTRLLILVVALFAAGCGSSSTAPTAPSVPNTAPLVFAGQSSAMFDCPFLTAAYPGPVRCVSEGATSIVLYEPGGAHWPEMLAATTPDVRAIVWWLGETDGLNGMTTEFAAHLTAEFTTLRRLAQNPRLPIVMVRILPEPEFDRIRPVQVAWARADCCTTLLVSDDLPRRPPAEGSYHLTDAGYAVMAQRIITALPR